MRDEHVLPFVATDGRHPVDADGYGLDVLLAGTVFFDLIFTGLDRLPRPGEEIWAPGMGSCPGGIANLATATARLDLRTGLVAGFGDDAYGEWMWQTLSRGERIDLSASRRFPGLHTSVTVSMAQGDDRAMVTHGHDLPLPMRELASQAPRSRLALVDLGGDTDWWRDLAALGTRIIADVGFDETGRWDPANLEPLAHCYGFTPNAVEAMAYTRTDSPEAAVRALAELVPLAIVTDGARGAHAIDASTGEQVWVPAVPVQALDATGAGDVFAAGTVFGLLAGWPLRERLAFAALCSALAVQQFGGSLAAPGWGDIQDWYHERETAAQGGDASAAELLERYAFLPAALESHCPCRRVRRAEGTFAIFSDAEAGQE